MIDLILNIFGLEKTPINQYKQVFNLYKLFILIVILYSVIYNSIYCKKEYIGFIIFKYNYIIQYVILSINLNKIENNENFDKILIISQLIVIIQTISIIYFNTQILNITNILVNIGEFLGCYIYFNSILIFTLLLIKIYQFIKNIKDSIDNLNNKELDNIIKIYEELMINKYKISKIVTNFNYIFNFYSLINIISISICYENYVFIKNDKYVLYSYFVLIIYFLIQEFICVAIILYSRYIRENILSELYSPLFVNNYIKKNDILSLNDKFNLNIEINDINIDNNIIYNKTDEIQKTNDWIILYISLNNKWIEFKICGVEIHSFDSICKILVYSSIVYKLLI